MSFIPHTYISTIYVFIAALFACLAVALPSRNITITVPDGTSDHGNPKLLCTPTRWHDIAVFYLLNYVTHIATIKPYPGEPISHTVLGMILALIFPLSGALRGLNAIFCGANLAKDPLQKAARAGAMCMVVRGSNWKPRVGEKIDNLVYMTPQLSQEAKQNGGFTYNPTPDAELEEIRKNNTSSEFEIVTPLWTTQYSRTRWLYACEGELAAHVSIHGICTLPEGYRLAYVPRTAKLASQDNSSDSLKPYANTVSASNSIGKSSIALLQAIYASITLYRTRGDQLEQFGYAAFGLTVAPYAVMSIVNLIGGIMTPEYAAVYMVSSDIMDEARKRPGARFDGVVGELITKPVIPMWPNSVAPHLLSGSFDVDYAGRLEVHDVKQQSMEESTEDTASGSAENAYPQPAVVRDSKGPQHMEAESSQAAPTFQIPSCNNYARFEARQRIPYPGHGIEGQYGYTWAVGCLAILINGVISGFKSGSSTTAQRAWIMAWLTMGICMAPISAIQMDNRPFLARTPNGIRMSNVMPPTSSSTKESLTISAELFCVLLPVIFLLALYASPAVGGLVVVGQMLRSFGTCVRLF